MTIPDLEKRVVSAAIYALCGSGSITAGCHADAATLVLVWAKSTGLQEFDEQEIEAKTEEAYNYFEFGADVTRDAETQERYPEPVWAVWDWPPRASASPST